MIQLLLHLLGDFIIQNDNVGIRKKEKSLTGLFYCIYYCTTYFIPFLLIITFINILLLSVNNIKLK